jgi:hypothetical protein
MISKIPESRHFERFAAAQGSRTFSNVWKIRGVRGGDLSIERRRRGTRSACAPGSGKAGLGALPDQAALEFRQPAKHAKNQPPLRGRGVKGLGQAAPDICSVKSLRTLLTAVEPRIGKTRARAP